MVVVVNANLKDCVQTKTALNLICHFGIDDVVVRAPICFVTTASAPFMFLELG